MTPPLSSASKPALGPNTSTKYTLFDRPRSLSCNYARCSNLIAIILIVSAFLGDQSIKSRLVKLTAAAALTFSVHAVLLCYAPPEEQHLSSLILCMIGGSMTVYISLLLLW
ncbi:hypothetical protein BDV26DRAFT_275287 [Aspergillus bertholletiae]|uniref:Uncharacterized protein n=1 Tax=Aspergillus bertholletiae TaxID=1226010 RepID=A0A5N7APS2_9EURO|nr:hypothetical protein BDV26DRAFT_275287 [Aspergillus bertholletiae]